MEILGVPLRDVILVVSGLAGIYLVVTALRLYQVGRRKSAVPAIDADAPPAEADAGEDEDADEEVYVYPKPRVAAPEEPASFGSELARSHLEREVKQLREEVVALRDELADLKAASRVSPQYADAMALAQRGLTAQDVADRCGISLAEAELVWALARGLQNLDQEDEYGGEPGRNHARSA